MITVIKRYIRNRNGGLGGDVLLWLLGVPLPVIILISLLRGCR
jgi:hypothetical protein